MWYDFQLDPMGVNNELALHIDEYGVVYSLSENPNLDDNRIIHSTSNPTSSIEKERFLTNMRLLYSSYCNKTQHEKVKEGGRLYHLPCLQVTIGAQ